MSFIYSPHSLAVRDTLHPDLIIVFDELLEIYDHKHERGIRTLQLQRIFVKQKISKTLKSEHLPFQMGEKLYSRAVDSTPFPVNYDMKDQKNVRRFYYMAGLVEGIATKHGIAIRWGGDWDGDRDFKDQTFDDLVHYELIPRRPAYR